MEHYKISEFAAMVGLPQSKIRFYEKYGLLEVKRSENGYRYYTPEDAFRVNAFRTLLQYGFTVEQAIGMLDEKQGGEVFLDSLKAQRTHLNQEEQLLKYRLNRLDYAIKLIESESDLCSDFHITDVTDYLYVHASHGRDFSISAENEDLIACFVELLSISSYARLISRSEFDTPDGSINPSYIAVIPLSEAHRLPDIHDRRLHQLNMGKCLSFRRYATRAQSVQKATFQKAFDYMEAHGYEMRYDFLIFPTFLNLDGEGRDIETVLIPVK